MFDDLLLLKKGGRVVYFGELGERGTALTKYFEDRGARPIERGENPANWVLTVMTSEEKDFADVYLQSEQYQQVKTELLASKDNLDESKKISYKEEFAAPRSVRGALTNRRLMRIYWRSPSYNLSRITVSAIIAIIMASVLVRDRGNEVFSETQMRAQFAVIFLSFIIVGIMSIFSVLPVMLGIRDMFYQHRASGMIGSASLGWALGSAEKGFILFSTTLFTLIFLGISYDGSQELRGRISFWVSSNTATAYANLFSISHLKTNCLLLTGILHIQRGHLFLLWPSFCLLFQTNGYCPNPSQCFYWTQQLLLWPNC